MSLPCTTNPALVAVNSVASGIKSALAGGKSALGSLSSQANSLKSKITSLKPTIPALDSLQSELNSLRGASTSQINAFRDKWNGKVSNLNALITAALSGNLDICKDVPNVKMDPVTGATVQEAKESPTPNTAPVEVEPVKETVVDNSQKVSTGNSGVVPSDIKTQFEELVQKPYQQQVRSPLWKDSYEKSTAESNLRKSTAYKSAVAKYKTWVSEADIAANGTSEEIELINSIKIATLKRRAADIVKQTADNYFRFNVEIVDDSTVFTEVQYWRNVKEIGNSALKLSDNDVLENMQDIRPWLTKIDSILTSNSQTVIDYANYKNNTS